VNSASWRSSDSLPLFISTASRCSATTKSASPCKISCVGLFSRASSHEMYQDFMVGLVSWYRSLWEEPCSSTRSVDTRSGTNAKSIRLHVQGPMCGLFSWASHHDLMVGLVGRYGSLWEESCSSTRSVDMRSGTCAKAYHHAKKHIPCCTPRMCSDQQEHLLWVARNKPKFHA
jgi:hypothetical protein